MSTKGMSTKGMSTKGSGNSKLGIIKNVPKAVNVVDFCGLGAIGVFKN